MNKKGFTLVELLAVIAILAILVIIALPNVINMYNKAQKETFLTEAKKIYTEAEKKYISSSIKGDTVKTISSEDDSKLDMTGEKLQYCVILNNSGKVTDIKVSNGKWVASLIDGKTVDELTIDDLKDGNLDGYECGTKKPKSFKDDSWDTIVEAVRSGNDGVYNVGDTKEVDMGTYGTHTLRIANTSTPSECSGTGFSQSACGFVLEFADIITTHNMNPKGEYKGTTYNYGWNKDGWPATSMRTFVNNDIYNAIPVEIKNAIIDTTVVSGHGKSDTENFTTTDKLYLLAPKEIYTNAVYDTAKDLTRTLDYYKNLNVTTGDCSGAIKKNETSAYGWWLRAAHSNTTNTFSTVYYGGRHNNFNASYTNGVAPAFRLG